ncbi:MAG TPA: bifunctional lysylphosphatidylglycerol flippase/synthetase MprF [Syntrophales bacterium]|nr:bifunctional lysylphosphatidylglycerol flippase/synthetase MprF [Syntrophales bacterium]
MAQKGSHYLSLLFGLLLFSGALLVLSHELKAYHLKDILRNFHDIPISRIALALAITTGGYLTMTVYDTLALRYIRHPLSYGKIILVAFTGYAFGNNIGLSMIAGASIRYYLYSLLGLTSLEITRLVAFCVTAVWLGFLALGGIVFLLHPVSIPPSLHLPFTVPVPLGILLLSVVLLYLAGSLFRKKPVRIWKWSWAVPAFRLAVVQVGVATADWFLAGLALYMLMPPSGTMPLLVFLSIYLMSQLAGLVSQVPGGLGVFETVFIVLASPSGHSPEIFAALIVYRGLYYLLPFGIAIVLLALQEAVLERKRFLWLAASLRNWIPRFVPNIAAILAFAGGVLLLFSGATPSITSRMAWLGHVLPLPAIEVSHFLGSIAGALLLIVARGLWRRIEAAWAAATALLGAGILLSLAKGMDYEEALALFLLFLILLPCRRFFYRKSTLVEMRFSSYWTSAVALAVLSSLWLLFFSFKHVDYSHELWWQFTFDGDAPRSMRAAAGSAAAVLLYAFARLLHPPSKTAGIPGREEHDRIVSIVRQSPRTYACLALLGDKTFLFNEGKTAFVMYGVEGRSWISMGDPVGPRAERAELAWKFRDMADQVDGWTVFYEVGSESLPLYIDLGLTVFNFGEEAVVPLETFSLEGAERKGLRHEKNRLEKEGCSFEILDVERIPDFLPRLKEVSDAWLAEKKAGEKGFSLGRFSEPYMKQFPAAVVHRNGRIVAFANLWPGGRKEEISVDLMRYHPDAPRGVMEYLFLEVMLWGKAAGYKTFNLGMAPLSGLDTLDQAHLWNRLGNYLFHHGEHFYNFQGLRRYKEKFDPVWHPKYLACPAGLALPKILMNLATLVAGAGGRRTGRTGGGDAGTGKRLEEQPLGVR